MFENMIHGGFADYDSGYNDFVEALLQDDLKAMNVYMNRAALSTFSFFDSGTKPSAESEPERFYHGFAFKGKEILVKKSLKIIKRTIERN